MAIIDETIKKMIQNGEKKDAINYLYTLEPLDLVLLRTDDNNKASSNEIIEFLNSPELEPFWADKFNGLRVGGEENGFQFRNPEPQSRADFYCGYILYLAAISVKNQATNKYEEYLSLARLNYKSFHAFQEYFNYTIDLLANDNTKINEFYQLLRSQESDLLEFKTPGCLLLANTYFYLASIYQAFDVSERSTPCFKLCWEYLHMAQLLETFSEIPIHNAYFEQGLAFSNGFGLSSIDEMKDKFDEVADGAIPVAVKFLIEEKANNTVNKFITNGFSIIPKSFEAEGNVKPYRRI